MANPKFSLTNLLGTFDKDGAQKRINSSAFRKQWRKWFKNLLKHILAAHFPTLDTAEAVEFLEAHCHGKETELPMVHGARMLGHVCALFDYFLENGSALSPEDRTRIAQMRDANPTAKTSNLLDYILTGLDFQERAEVQKEFSFAYNETITPMGELKGYTDATPVYFETLIWAMIWMRTTFPKNKKEAFIWMTSLNPRTGLTRLDQIKHDEREHDKFKRYLQIWHRLGWNLGGKMRMPTNAKRDIDQIISNAVSKKN